MKDFGPEKDLPHNIEAEQQLLGAVMVRDDAFDKVADILSADDFYEPLHARIYATAGRLVSSGRAATPVTLQSEMANDPGLLDIGVGYLARLAGGAVSSTMVREYADVVREAAAKRALLHLTGDVAQKIGSGATAGDCIAVLERFVTDSGEVRGEPRSMSVLAATTRAIKHMVAANEGKALAIPTGLTDFDRAVPLMPKRYTILAGSTSMGKSAIAAWIAYFAAKQGFGVGYVSREMSEEDIARRINSIESGIPYKAYDGKTSEATLNRVLEVAKAQQSLPIEVFSERVRDIPSVLTECRKLKRRWQPNEKFHGLKLLIVDYIQLMDGRGQTAFERLSDVANELKAMAKLLDVHVLALAQLDRRLTERDDPRPKLPDLRGSGDLENAPDNVVFIHRPSYKLDRTTTPSKVEDRVDFEADKEFWKGKAELIAAKARMGEITTVKIRCDLATNKFWDDEVQEGMDF